MKCAYCGKNNKPGALVCKRCGVALPVSPSNDAGAQKSIIRSFSSGDEGEAKPAAKEAKGKRSLKLKKPVMIGIAAVLAAVAALAVLILCLSGNKGITLPKKHSYSAFGSPTGIFYDGANACPDGFAAKAVTSSIDGQSAGLIAEDGTLFSLSKGEYQAVAKGIDDIRISADGSRLIYRDASELLWSYEIGGSQKAPVCIFNEAAAPGFTVSPDGKSVLFLKRSDSKLCLLTGGKIREVGEKLYPVSVSNGGKHIYAYSDSENALYYTTKKGRASYIRSNIIGDVFLNKAHDEIVFSIRSGEDIVITMISKAGGEPVEIINSAEPVVPVLTVSSLTMRDELLTHHTVTCPFKSFEGKLFSGGALIRYSAKGNTVLEPVGTSKAIASDDYRTVLYMISGGLSKRLVANDGAADRIVESCADYMCSDNCSTVWYVGADGSLNYLKGNKSAVIAPHVDSRSNVADGEFPYWLDIMPDGKTALFSARGMLCTNKGGSPKQSFTYPEAKYDDIEADRSGFYLLSANAWKKLEASGEKIDLTK